jgi:Na+/H+ antiporter NhaD/arsenite permease-like protein
MTELQQTVTFAVFAAVLLCTTTSWLDMAVAALLGVSALTLFGIFDHQDILEAARNADGSLALLFAGMVMARVLEPTKIFDHLGTRFLRLTKGSGKRFLLGLVALVSTLCAFLPNATTVVLLAPVIVRICCQLGVDFVGPMVLTAIASNSAGMLTLVGDPATFMVGSAVGLSFNRYLLTMSLGGLLALLVLMALLPLLVGEIWRLRRELPGDLVPEPVQWPRLCGVLLGVLVGMIGLFVLGDGLPHPIVPPAASIIGASVALLVVHRARMEPITDVVRDVDWKTLIFLFCMFCLVQAVVKTGLVERFSTSMVETFGTNIAVVAIVVLVGVGVGSTVIANIPLVAAVLFLVKSYFVIAELVPEEALTRSFIAWPEAYIPVFAAMMFGGTLGGNATVIGASANVVSAGICAAQGQPISFLRFMRYGVPVTLAQLVLGALYVQAMLLIR